MKTTQVIRAHRTVNGRGVQYECPRLTLGADLLYAVGLDIADRVEIRVHPRRGYIEVWPAAEPPAPARQAPAGAPIAAAPILPRPVRR